MVKIYADLCELGLRTVNDAPEITSVPTSYKQAVISELKDRGRTDLIPSETV